MFVLSPNKFVSPFIHPKLNINFLHSEYTASGNSYNYTYEISTKAISIAGGLGGIVNIKDSVFLTLEARILYAHVMDPEREESETSGGLTTNYEDTQETTSSAICMDMVFGLRVLF
jgi:hypothetical protein